MSDFEMAELVGIETRRNPNTGRWLTYLRVAVETDDPPNRGVVAGWFTQTLRNADKKLGTAPLPAAPRRPRQHALPIGANVESNGNTSSETG